MSAADQNRHCMYTEEQVRESGLLTSERMAEVTAQISARIQPVFDGAGREITEAKVVDLHQRGRMLFGNLGDEHMVAFLRRSVLADVLTDEELTLINDKCSAAWSDKKEAERFQKAEKLAAWEKGVFWGDEYFASMDELIDRLEDDDEWPEYVWATEPTVVIPALDVSDVVEHHVCDRGWEDMDTDDLEGVSELQAALDRFVEANKGVCSYHPDYKKAVLLSAWRKQPTSSGE